MIVIYWLIYQDVVEVSAMFQLPYWMVETYFFSRRKRKSRGVENNRNPHSHLCSNHTGRITLMPLFSNQGVYWSLPTSEVKLHSIQVLISLLLFLFLINFFTYLLYILGTVSPSSSTHSSSPKLLLCSHLPIYSSFTSV